MDGAGVGQELLGSLVVVRVRPGRVPVELHRDEVVERVVFLGLGPRERGVGPSGEDVSQVLDVVLGIGGDRIAAAVELQAPVRVEEVDADREELHHLPRVVLVRRDRSCGVRLVVVDHVEVMAHCRIERQVPEDRPVVREGVRKEQVQVRRHRARRVTPGANAVTPVTPARGIRPPLSLAPPQGGRPAPVYDPPSLKRLSFR